jgi:hypothetical protein
MYDTLTVRSVINSYKTKVREVLKLLKYSPKLQSLLKRELQDENESRDIKLDARTRSNNLYDMLSYALKFK